MGKRVLLIKCRKLPGKEWRILGPWEVHLRDYLKSPREAYDGLHHMMRQVGVDWFEVHNVGKPLPPEVKEKISKTMKGRSKPPTGIQYYTKPNIKEWMVVTNAGTFTITNLAEWIRKHNLSRDAIKTRIKRNRWPYTPSDRPHLNILRITKWS